jgi:hypothetical protein
VAARFAVDPSADLLAEFLESIADDETLKEMQACLAILPWPVAFAIKEIKCWADLATLSSRAKAGDLGHKSDWLSAESRWKAAISEHDLVSTKSAMSKAIGAAGAPPMSNIIYYHSGVPNHLIDRVRDLCDKITDKVVASELANAAAFALAVVDETIPVSVETLSALDDNFKSRALRAVDTGRAQIRIRGLGSLGTETLASSRCV